MSRHRRSISAIRVAYLSAILSLMPASGGSALAAAPDDTAQKPPEQAPLAARTGQSGLPLSPVQQAMGLPHLTLAMTVHPESRTISARADYTVRALASLSQVEFDLDPRLAISAVTVNGKTIARSRWSNPDGGLVIRLPRTIRRGHDVRVAITYAGKPFIAPKPPWIGGFVWSTAKDATGKQQPWIATAVQGQGCDLFWPCLDHFSKRVGVLDFLIDVPDPLVAASNGKLIDSHEENGRRIWHWRARTPNDYGVSLQIGPYDVARRDYISRFGETIPTAFWYLPGDRPGAEAMLGEMQDFLRFFESTVGPYPWSDEKVGLAETPHLGMEHQTINAYGNHFKPSPEGYDWLMHHEFSHEWFANQLTNARNADMWLQEGLGTYMQPLYLRWKNGDMAYDAAMWDLRKKVRSIVPLAPDSEVPSTYYDDKDAHWGGDIYYKGAWIAHTLRLYIGDAAFSRALRLITYGRDDPRPGNFTHQIHSTADFRHVVETVTGKPMGWFFDAYFHVAALPRLETRVSGTTLDLTWHTPAPEPFVIPVQVEIDGTTHTVAMDGGHGSIRLPAPDAHYVIDPQARILRDDPAITRWQAFEDRQAKEKAEKEKAKKPA